MATTSWTRGWVTAQPWGGSAGSHLIAKLNSGQSLLQVYLAWSFMGNTSTTVIPAAIAGQVAAAGLVTVIGNGTETPPDALASPLNPGFPAQRWLIWDVRAPRVRTWDTAGSVATWTATEPQIDMKSSSQVLAPSGMGVGNTLDLWLSWSTFGGWDASGQAVLWFSFQALVRTP